MEQIDAHRPPLFSSQALRRLMIPLIFEQLLAMTVGMADTIMITAVGEEAVSGVALVDTINILIIQVLAALCTGGAVVCSQYLGRQEQANARMAARQLVYTVVALMLAVAIPLTFLRRQTLLLVFGRLDAAVMDHAMSYFLLTSLSFPFLAVYNACAALYRSMGNSRVSLMASAIMNVINIGGNAVLIYGCGWGAAGAGAATLASRIAAAVIMLLLIRKPVNVIHLAGLHRVRLDFGMIRSILRIGVPSGFENGLFQVGKLLVQTLIAGLGTAAIAANAIINSVSSVLLVPGVAAAYTMITVVGQCVGAGDYDQARGYTRRLMSFTYLAVGLINLPFLFFSRPVFGLFHLSAGATDMACAIMPVLAVAHMAVYPLAFPFANVLRAAGDVRFTMIVSIISMWLLRVGLSYVLVLGFQMGLAGVWCAMFADWIGRILCFVPRYISGKWKGKRVIP